VTGSTAGEEAAERRAAPATPATPATRAGPGPGDFGRAAETPSGKGAGDENFPVGSWLLPARLRPHVAKFYAFARAIDDIADNPALAPDDKIRRLERFEAAIAGRETDDPALATAHRLRASLAETGVPARHCLDLIAAFKQDAVKLRYDDWDDLIGYCTLSANPVGRYLLNLHGEDPAGYGASDALCSALQVINHLQDCADDYRNLDRVYLPQDWMAAEGVGVEALAAPACSPGLRRVLERCLDASAGLLAGAEALPARLRSRHLALESAVIVALARRLVGELRGRDPLAERVVLSKAESLRVALPAAFAELARRLFARRGPASAARP
jgi:squalene synthase HpnC